MKATLSVSGRNWGAAAANAEAAAAATLGPGTHYRLEYVEGRVETEELRAASGGTVQLMARFYAEFELVWAE
mgnify:CR=1 FL=1